MSNTSNEELLRKIEEAPLLMSQDKARKKLKKPRSVYADQILFMATIVFLAVYNYGFRALSVCIVSVLACIIVDMLGCFFSKKEYNVKDLSTIAYGLALALMLPASVDYYIVLLGAVLTITVKHIFGGKDNYIFNPTAVAIAFLIMCYPTKVLMYPEKGVQMPIFGTVDVALSSGIESNFIKNGSMPDLSVLDILMGNFLGPMGTTHILVLAVCGICLMFRKSISFFSTIGGMAVMAGLTYLITPTAEMVTFQFINGFVLFGFIFLASDPQTLPYTNGGRLLYGLSLGIITTVFRQTANIEGVFVFSLLVVNALSLYLDRLAYNIGTATANGVKTLGRYLGTFERVQKNVKQGKTTDTPNIGDTQELIIEPVNFNMPPIDSKVTKVKRRRKMTFGERLMQIGEKIGNATNKDKEKINNKKPKDIIMPSEDEETSGDNRKEENDG